MRIVLLSLLIGIFSLSLNASSFIIKLTNDEIEYIKNNPTVKYSEVDWKPLSIIENNQMIGIMGDFIKIVENKTGLKFQFVPSNSWPDVLEKFKNKELDVVPGIGNSPQELLLGLISQRFAKYPMVIVTKDKYRYIDDLNDLNEKIVAVPKFYTSYNFVKEFYPNIKIYETNSIQDALIAVHNGKAEAFVGHIATSLHYMKELHMVDLKISGHTSFSFEHHFLVQDKKPILLSIINKVIDSISVEEKKEVYSKWVQIHVNDIDYKTLIVISTFFLIILFGLGLRNKQIKIFNLKLLKDEQIILEEKKKFEMVFKNSKEALSLVSLEDKKFLMTNKEFNLITQKNEQELSKIDIEELLFKDEKLLFTKIVDEVKEYGYCNDIILDYSKAAFLDVYSVIKFNFSICKIDSDKYLVSIKNITEKFFLEEKLNQEKKKAEISAKAKSEFLANMSHEIRTPMNGILSLVQLLLRNELSLKQKEYLKIIEQSTKNLLVLINDILDYSKIESGKLQIINEEFDHYMMIDNVISIVKNLAYEKDLDIKINFDDKLTKYIYADRTRISQVLLNLLSNAVKFTSHGEIIIDIKKIHQNKIRISVEDTGIGIKKEHKDKLFLQFEQIDNSLTKKYKGTGLGLAISKKLSQLMFGDLYFDFERSIGTKVIFEFEMKEIQNKDKFDLPINTKIVILENDISWNKSLISCFKVFDIKPILLDNYSDFMDLKKTFETPYLLFIDVNFLENMDMRKIKELQEDFIIIDKKDKSTQVLSKYNLENKISIAKPLNPNYLQMILSSNCEHNNFINKESKNIDFMKNKNVLIFEDNELNQNIVRMLFEEQNVFLDIVPDGILGLEKFKANPSKYDLILMDIQMPKMDGYEATKELRKLDKNIPILGLSANAFESDINQAISVGMNDYISKPIDVNDFYEKIAKCLNTSFSQSNINSSKEIKSSNLFKWIDPLEGLKNSFGKKNVYDEIMISFYEKYNNIDIENLDFPTYKNMIHSMKNLTLHIGAVELHKIAIELDKDLENAHIKKLFIHRFNDVLKDIQNYNKIENNDKKENLVKIDFKESLEKLKEQVERKRFRDCKNSIDKLENGILTKEEKELVLKLKNFIENRNFYEAKNILEGLIND